MKLIDLTGQKFERLLVLRKGLKRYPGKNSSAYVHWKCKCDCGNILTIGGDSLRNNHAKSCGCIKKEKFINMITKHNDAGKQFYMCWYNMKHRCNNSSNKHFKNYGGRGITYDPKWENYKKFKEDMYFKYLYALKQLSMKTPSIEREDVNGNYCFDNCIFIPRPEQNKNKRNIK
jgi:hypothetical protein